LTCRDKFTSLSKYYSGYPALTLTGRLKAFKFIPDKFVSVTYTNPYKYFVVKNRDIFQSGQALIAANSPPYWQNQQQRQADKRACFYKSYL
jgi:hypothetical protein